MLLRKSPPHAWGILTLKTAATDCNRVTPTRVGNTRRACRPCRWPRDHPHTCGEYLRTAFCTSAVMGSPPHVWGIPPNLPKNDNEVRITPTRVGNTTLTASSFSSEWDHPHTCGEYPEPTWDLIPLIGPPPHVWGIRFTVSRCNIVRRTTPTRVGNTSKHLSRVLKG